MQPVETVPYVCPVCGSKQFIRLGDGSMEATRYCVKCSADIDVSAMRAEHGLETLTQADPEVPEHVREGH